MKNKSLIRAIVIATFCCIIAYLAFSLQPRDGWRVKRGSTQYILDGKPVTGWQIIDDSRFTFPKEEVFAPAGSRLTITTIIWAPTVLLPPVGR